MADEEITSLPWLLERVAGRLELLSHRIKEEEAKGRTFNMSSKNLKETLLHAIATSGNNILEGNEGVEQLLNLLEKRE